ncbi:hypothetical protein VTN00DRAFT_3705 [Thermoascus crustaceus]|uniref:uncharacterized protein n=1 Tax=Thermoascus crustaceus TaxID=5088 RepID=UPI0037439D41
MLDHDTAVMDKLNEDDPLSAEDLAKLEHLANEYKGHPQSGNSLVFWFWAIRVSKVEFFEEFLAPTAVFYGLPRILKVIITLPFQKS